MRLQSIELITRQNGFFRFRGKLIPAIRPNDGVGVALIFKPSCVDKDFSVALDPETYLWFPTSKQLQEIMKALDSSDEQTFQMLRTEWGGERPRSIKLEDMM